MSRSGGKGRFKAQKRGPLGAAWRKGAGFLPFQ
jgi:hypothetical protein